MDSKLLYYQTLAEFKRQFYKDLITDEHYVGEVKFDTLTYVDGSIEEEMAFFGYHFKKNGKKYIVSHNLRDRIVDVNEMLPMFVREEEKVAHRTDVYYLINHFDVAKFNPSKSMTFRELVNCLSCMKHTNKKHQMIIWFIEFAQMYNRCNFRIASPAGFGKDSVVDIMGNLVGGAATIESPTLAKLEERSKVLKHLAINEVVDMTTADWRIVQQYLLTAGAFKPEITKHSRAFGNVGETIDISNFSLSLLYNDIDHYTEPEEYFDYVTKKQVIDRFPAIRVYGTYSEKFNSIHTVDVSGLVQNNMELYKNLIRAYIYYRNNMQQYIHGYTWQQRKQYPERWRTNIGRLADIIDMYSESQEEFTEWMDVLYKCFDDYDAMLDYPDSYKKLIKKLSIKEQRDANRVLETIHSYTGKLKYIESLVNGTSTYRDVSVDNFWEERK